MKKILVLAICIVALFAALRHASADPTLVLLNDSSYGLGTATVTGPEGSYGMPVPAPGSFPISLSTVSSITISGQTVNAPDNGPVVLPSGAKVSIHWTANSIEVIDTDIEN